MTSVLRFLLGHPLLKGRPFLALRRFFGWQLRSRLSSDPVVFDWVPPARLWMRRGWSGLTGNVYAGLYDYEEMSFLLHFLRPGDLFLDVGANMGSYTVLASAVCGSSAIAYEPCREAADRLEANLVLNGVAQRVTLRRCAVGAENGRALVSHSLGTGNRVLMGDETDGVETAMVSLDRDVLRSPAMIKVDVEGFELEVLKGSAGHLADPGLRAVILEVNGQGGRYGTEDSAVHALMAAHGFIACGYEPSSRTLAARPEGFRCDNRIYCRDLGFVVGRLASAPAFTVEGRNF